MKSDNFTKPEYIGCFFHCLIPSFGAANVISCCKEVTRVQAYSQPFRLFYLLINGGQMFKFAAKAAPLPRRIFEGDSHRGTFRRAKHFIQARDNLLQSFGFPLSQVGARMQYQKWKPELRREIDFL